MFFNKYKKDIEILKEYIKEYQRKNDLYKNQYLIYSQELRNVHKGIRRLRNKLSKLQKRIEELSKE